jgi:hypothetical protein
MILSFLASQQINNSWTDVVQALAAAVAIPAAIWSFRNLFKKGKKTDEQITSLTALAEEARAHTGIMSESNQLQNEFNVKLAEILSLGQEVSKIQAAQKEKGDQQRKITIKPRIINYGGMKSGSHISFRFKNIGEKCKVINIKEGAENKTVIIGLGYFEGRDLETGVEHEITWKKRGQEDPYIDIDMVVEDVEHNQYKLKFSGPGRTPSISELEEIQV